MQVQLEQMIGEELLAMAILHGNAVREAVDEELDRRARGPMPARAGRRRRASAASLVRCEQAA